MEGWFIGVGISTSGKLCIPSCACPYLIRSGSLEN